MALTPGSRGKREGHSLRWNSQLQEERRALGLQRPSLKEEKARDDRNSGGK